MSQKRVVLIILAALLVLVVVAFVFRPTAISRPLPSPNGYDALIAAAQQLTEAPYEEHATKEQFESYISANSNALAEIKAALELECLVPTMFGSEEYTLSHMSHLMHSKRAAQALAAEGHLAELNGKPDEAAAIYICIIDLGQEVTRNGCAIDMLVGMACEALGAGSLKQLIPQLNAQTCLNLTQKLEAMENEREPLALIKKNESHYMRSQFKWRLLLTNLREVLPSASVLRNAWTKYSVWSNETKLLATRLAARAYELEKGAKPQSFNDLVPVYLKAVPADSETGTNLVFELED